MKLKVILLKIIKENQPLGIHKLDRLFYSNIDSSANWPSVTRELRKEGLIEENGYKITQKGLEYLEQHSEE